MTYKQIVQIMWILLIAVSSFFCVGKGFAATELPRQAIVLFIDGMSFEDVDNLRAHPQMQRALASASYGAMSIRTPGARTAENTYLLLGSGSQAVYSSRSDTAYMADELLASGETAGQRLRRVGDPVNTNENKAAILFPGIHRLLNENQEKPYTERIGLLGSMLESQGIKVTLYGNADYGGIRQRPAALFAMNRKGEIAGGDVSAAQLQYTPDDPYGVRTDYVKLTRQLAESRSNELTVVELADLSRLYRLREEMSEERFATQYERVMSDMATFLSSVTERRTPNQLLLVMSSSVNPVAQQAKSLLLPVFMWQDKQERGSLTSYTTRQGGLVSGLDVLPTLATWFGLSVPADLAGHVMKQDDGSNSMTVDGLLAKVSWIDHIYRNRSTVLSGYVLIQIIVLLAALAAWLWQRRNLSSDQEGVKRPVRILLVSMLFYPGLFLLEPLLPWRVPAPIVLGLLVLLSLTASAFLEKRGFVPALTVVSLFTAGCILVDGFLHSNSISRSYMGYDPVIGARFYGLGNELEGVLIGSSILLAALVCEGVRARSTKRANFFGNVAVICWFSLVLVYMALPSLGANAGGFLAGAIGFGVAFMRFRGREIKKRGLLLVTGTLAIGIFLLIFSNLWSGQPITHVGRVAQQIVDGDWAAVSQIIERKLAMNVKLIRVSVWSKVVLVSLIAISLLTFYSGRFLRRLAQKRPMLVGGFHGVVAGSLAGLVLNDSGIISAATSIIFFVIPALYAALDDDAVSANRST